MLLLSNPPSGGRGSLFLPIEKRLSCRNPSKLLLGSFCCWNMSCFDRIGFVGIVESGFWNSNSFIAIAFASMINPSHANGSLVGMMRDDVEKEIGNRERNIFSSVEAIRS